MHAESEIGDQEQKREREIDKRRRREVWRRRQRREDARAGMVWRDAGLSGDH